MLHEELMIGVAHMAVSHDLLITTSPRLLALRDNREYLRKDWNLAGINPLLPTEAVRIAALFQRSRDEYRPRDNSEEIPRRTIGRSAFYSVLAYENLPNAWLYESACGRARLSDDTYQLSKSVLVRCMRALEARDTLGQLFYVPNYDSITDRVVYHFDYLSLILFGAFDAMARLAHRVYKIKKPNEHMAGFHRQDFRDALKAAGAMDLENLVSNQRFQDILFVVGKLRNNIHGAAVEAWHVGSIENLNMAQIEIPDNQAAKFWSRFTSLGAGTDWGVQKQHPSSSGQVYPYSIRIEPYTFASRLLRECLPIINEIMATTEVVRLLPVGVDQTELRTGPGPDNFYPPKLREEIGYLGQS